MRASLDSRLRLHSRLRASLWALGSLAVLGVALHCGSSAEGSLFSPDPNASSPCDTFYKGLCGKPCGSDGECAEGLYCAMNGINGTCTADCVRGGACQSGAICSSRGRCGGVADLPPASFADSGEPPSDASLADVFCADIDVSLAKILPKVLFLLDQSSSMFSNKFPSGDSNDCTPSCRWTVLKDVLIGPSSNPGGLVKQLEAEAELAVKMYSATDSNPNDNDNSYLTGPTDNVCPRFNGKAFDGLTFAVNSYAAIDAYLRPSTVDDDTPTGPAIRTVVGLSDDGGVGSDAGFAAIASTAPKVIVLVTDGEPAICGDNFPSDPGRAAVISAVQQTYTQKIQTYVIAIGDTSVQAEAHFKSVANAGQGKDIASGDAGAIRPNTPQELVDALKQIVLDARTCTFDLNGKVEPGLEKLGTVTLNGAPVPFDAPGLPDEGWRLVTASRIELVGNACATLKATPNAQLSARFPCGAVTPNVPK